MSAQSTGYHAEHASDCACFLLQGLRSYNNLRYLPVELAKMPALCFIGSPCLATDSQAALHTGASRWGLATRGRLVAPILSARPLV